MTVIGPGCLVPVVGPSGAGKDSLIRAAQLHFGDNPKIAFPRRMVTRRADVNAEDHDSISDADFALAVANGGFALWWEAHGLRYGIPSAVNSQIAAGSTVIFNCSRQVLEALATAYENVLVIEVTAPESVLVDRIVARGRENHEQAVRRVTRQTGSVPSILSKVTICNDDSLAAAASRFVRAIEHSQQLAANPRGHAFDGDDKQEDRDDGGRRLVVVEHFK